MEKIVNCMESKGIEPEKLSILVVDTREEVQTLERDIRKLGHGLQAASSYDSAVKKALKQKFDLVFMDINLPKGDWVDAVSRIRETTENINIVTMTEENSRKIEQRVRDQKVTYYILKPIEYHEIESIIDHFSKKKGKNPGW